MKFASLFSGGKDSTFATYLIEQQGHVVEYLIGVVPTDPHSWLFHTPNLQLLPLQSRAMEKPLIMVKGGKTEEEDLLALKSALQSVEVDGIVTGAIASEFQWERINSVCEELEIPMLSPLWRKDEYMIVKEEIEAGIKSIVVSVSSEGLGSSHLGIEIDDSFLAFLKMIHDRFGVHIAGEGGEYESLVLDSPLHKAPLQLLEISEEIGRDHGRLIVKEAVLGEAK